MSKDRISIQGEGQMSPHFSRAEIRRVSSGVLNDMDAKLFDVAEKLRFYSGNSSVRVTSAIRDYIPTGGAKNSAHLRGNAVDIALSASQMKELQGNLLLFFDSVVGKIGGFGVYNWGVHIDTEQDNISRFWSIKGIPLKEYWVRHWASGTDTWMVPGSTFNQPDEPQHDDPEEANEDIKEHSTTLFNILILCFTAYIGYQLIKQ